VWVSGNNRQHCDIAYVCGHYWIPCISNRWFFTLSQNQPRIYVCFLSFSSFSLHRRCIRVSYTIESSRFIILSLFSECTLKKGKIHFSPGKVLKIQVTTFSGNMVLMDHQCVKCGGEKVTFYLVLRLFYFSLRRI